MFRILFALLLLFVVIVAAAPSLIPVAAFKGRIEAEASKALGRPVSIGEKISLRIFPKTAFRAEQLEIGNAEGFDEPYLARVKVADIGVRLMPLFSGRVEIERFVLTEPDIVLVKAADGRINWNLAAADASAKTENAPQSSLKDLTLGDVRIVDGRASYVDLGASQNFLAEDVDAVARLAGLATPFELEGSMMFEGAPSRFELVLTNLSALLNAEPANLKLKFSLGDATAETDLTLSSTEELSWTGPFVFAAPDLPAFTKLIGAPMQEGAGFDSLSVQGLAKGDSDGVALSDAVINFDKIDASGDLALDWSGAKPKASGRLTVGSLDLRPYLPPPPPPGTAFPAWSTERLDFASLRNIDAAIDVAASKIFMNGMTFDKSRLNLRVENGRLSADIPQLGLYGGVASGTLTVNARSATPSIAGRFDASDVVAQAFAVDVLKNDRLLGLGAFTFEFSASGTTQAAIMNSLDGKGGFDLADGAIKGVNLAKLTRSIDQLRRGGVNPAAIQSALAAAQSPDEKTDFTSFLSAFGITDGRLSATALDLKGPFVTMTGGGGVNLGAQTIALKLAPRATSTIDGKGGTAIAVPLLVSGTFAAPKMSIDVETLLRGQLERGLTDFLGGQRGADAGAGTTKAGGVLKAVLGGDADADAATSQEATPEEALAKGVLNQIFAPKKAPASESEPAREPQP